MSQLVIYSLDNVKNLSPRERQVYTDVRMEAAAEGIFNALDNDLKDKYTPKQIFNLIKNNDKNKDGIITKDEVTGDVDNIFGLKTSDNKDKLERIQSSVKKEQELSDIKSLQKGLDTNRFIWAIAKPLIINHITAENLKEMFSNQAVVKYYSEGMGKNSETNKHLVELFKAKKISVNDIKNMGFADDTLKDLLKLYEEK